MSHERRFWIFLAVIALICLFLYGIRMILLPFILGLLIAYFLDPVVDRLERRRFLGRTSATTVVIGAFFLVVTGVILLIAPMLYSQSVELIHKLPELLARARNEWFPRGEALLERLNPAYVEQAKTAISESSANAVGLMTTVFTGVLQSGASLLNILSLLFIMPVVAFYLLKDWDRMVASADALLPPSLAPSIREQARAIDRTLSGYVRGQTNVCLILAVFYGVGLSLTGLKSGLAIGVLTGLLSFVPFVGFGVGCVIGMLIAWFQFPEWSDIGMVGGVFLLGQVLESNILTPRLIGERVGLHPVWVIFGMLAGGVLLGVAGVLLAVPLSAIAGVLIRSAVQKYLRSPLYSNQPIL